MNVSIWLMLLWLMCCFFTLQSFKKPKPLPELKEDEKETIVGLAVLFGLTVTVLHIIYAISATAVISNIFFTLLSAILIIRWIVVLWKSLIKMGEFMKGQLYVPKTSLTLFTILEIIHCVYFGFFIFFK